MDAEKKELRKADIAERMRLEINADAENIRLDIKHGHYSTSEI